MWVWIKKLIKKHDTYVIKYKLVIFDQVFKVHKYIK